jgi:hypothetical protein
MGALRGKRLAAVVAISAVVVAGTVVGGVALAQPSAHAAARPALAQPRATAGASRRLHGMYEPPAWVSKDIGRELKALHDRDPHEGLLLHMGKAKAVAEIFGEFTSGSGGHFTYLRLTMDAHTHRILSVLLGHRVGGDIPLRIAHKSNRYLKIFSTTPGKIRCAIPKGGLQLPGTAPFAGRCVTEYAAATRSSRGREIRILYGERWRSDHHVHRAAWIVTVSYRNGRVRSTQVIGQPPQLWK